MTALGGATALLVLAYLGFVSLGIPDSVLGAAWPVMRSDFGAALDAAGLLVLVTTAGVVVSSALSGQLLRRWSVGTVVAGSTAIAALALAAFAVAPAWPWLIVGAALAGAGGGAVDAALNGYVARHHSARQMSWLHACFGVGATVGPLAVAMALTLDRTWRAAYGGLAVVQGALAIAFVWTARRWPRVERQAAATRARAPLTRPMLAGVLFFFVYGGLEATAGLWCASYLVATRGVTTASAGAAVSLYWGALTVGRLVAGALAARAGEARLVRAACALVVVAVAALCLPGTPAVVTVAALAGLGLALAPIYPLTMHLTPRRHGPEVAVHLVGYQVAGCSAGIALVPWGVGAVMTRSSLSTLPAALAVLAVVLVALERGAAGRGTPVAPPAR